MRSIVNFFDKFESYEEEMRSRGAEINNWLQVLAAARYSDLDGAVNELKSSWVERYNDIELALKFRSLEEQSSNARLANILQDLEKPAKRMERHVADIQSQLNTERRLKILQWYSPLPYKQYHLQVHTEVLPGTGDWFIHDPRLIEWRDSSTPSMLWLHGPPGFGKMKLV